MVLSHGAARSCQKFLLIEMSILSAFQILPLLPLSVWIFPLAAAFNWSIPLSL